MVSNAQIGELLVGAYHNLVTDAEVTSYNTTTSGVYLAITRSLE